MSDVKLRLWGEGKAPCHGCVDRCIGCHGQEPNGLYKCERYGEFKKQAEAERAARDKIISDNDAMHAVKRQIRGKFKYDR